MPPIFMRIFNKIIKFGCPNKSNIVIYDEWHSDKIIKYILKEYDFVVYKIHPEEVMICPLALLIFINNISLFDIKMIKYRKDKLRAFFGQLLFCYRVAIIRIIKPKVIVTMIDNSYDFHELAEKYHDAEFFAIQNALRVNYDLKKDRKYYIPHYFTFGGYTEFVMSKYNHKILNYYPVGSFRLGIADKYMRSHSNHKYDIAIISQYRSEEYSDYGNEDIIERSNCMNAMHSFLSQYIAESGSSAVMVMAGNLKCEVDYYKKYYGSGVDYLFNDKEKMSSFSILHKCEVIVAFFSSLSIEALGIGRKVLRVDLTDGDNWNEYDDTILLKTDSYHDVKERLDMLLEETYSEYNDRIQNYSKYLMNYNPDFPPHEYIRSKIEEYI